VSPLLIQQGGDFLSGYPMAATQPTMQCCLGESKRRTRSQGSSRGLPGCLKFCNIQSSSAINKIVSRRISSVAAKTIFLTTISAVAYIEKYPRE
jgi:hypothetical protein